MAPLFRYMDHGEIPDSKELFVTKLDDKDFGEGEGLGLELAPTVKLIASRDVVPFCAPDAKSSPALLSLIGCVNVNVYCCQVVESVNA